VTASAVDVRAPRWLIAALRVDAAPDAPVTARIGTEQFLCAWPAEGDAGLREAVAAAAPALRDALTAHVGLGVGLPCSGTLLGATPSAIERRARVSTARRGIRLSRRLAGALEGLADMPVAYEILARAHPSVRARWTAWADVLEAANLPDEAASVRARGARLARREARRAAAMIDAELHEAASVLLAGRAGRAEALFARCEARSRDLGDLPRLLRAVRGRLAALVHLDELGGAERLCARVLASLPTAPMLASADHVLEGTGLKDGREANETVATLASTARTAVAAGRIGDARARFRSMLEVAEQHRMYTQARQARLGMAWAELRAGNADLAAAWCEKVIGEARGADPAAAALAAWVCAEARLSLSDFDEAARLLEVTEGALAVGAWAQSSLLPDEVPLPWVVASLRARILRSRHEEARALEILEHAIHEVERQGSALSGGPWPDVRVHLYGLAAEIAASLEAWDRVARWGPAAASPGIRPGQHIPDGAPGVDTVTLVCGLEDVLVLHHGRAPDARLVGRAPLVRKLAREIVDAQTSCGPLQGVLTLLSQALAESLAPLAGTTRPLAIRADDELRAIPWDLVPVHGRALATHRPVIELAVPGPRVRRAATSAGRCLLGTGLPLPPADRATLAASGVRFLDATRETLREPAAWTLLWCGGGPRRLTLADGEAPWWELAEAGIPGGVFLLGGAWPDDAATERIAAALVAAGADAVVAPATRVPEPESRAPLVDLATRLAAGEPLPRAFQLARVRAAGSFGPWGWTALAPYRLVVGNTDLIASAR
jgi:hypothetical protein